MVKNYTTFFLKNKLWGLINQIVWEKKNTNPPRIKRICEQKNTKDQKTHLNWLPGWRAWYEKASGSTQISENERVSIFLVDLFTSCHFLNCSVLFAKGEKLDLKMKKSENIGFCNNTMIDRDGNFLYLVYWNRLEKTLYTNTTEKKSISK